MERFNNQGASRATDRHCGLINEVNLHPTDIGFEIELVGEIAKMIALPGGSGSANLNKCSAKVVAGVGFEPTLRALGWSRLSL